MEYDKYPAPWVLEVVLFGWLLGCGGVLFWLFVTKPGVINFVLVLVWVAGWSVGRWALRDYRLLLEGREVVQALMADRGLVREDVRPPEL